MQFWYYSKEQAPIKQQTLEIKNGNKKNDLDLKQQIMQYEASKHLDDIILIGDDEVINDEQNQNKNEEPQRPEELSIGKMPVSYIGNANNSLMGGQNFLTATKKINFKKGLTDNYNNYKVFESLSASNNDNTPKNQTAQQNKTIKHSKENQTSKSSPLQLNLNDSIANDSDSEQNQSAYSVSINSQHKEENNILKKSQFFSQSSSEKQQKSQIIELGGLQLQNNKQNQEAIIEQKSEKTNQNKKLQTQMLNESGELQLSEMKRMATVEQLKTSQDAQHKILQKDCELLSKEEQSHPMQILSNHPYRHLIFSPTYDKLETFKRHLIFVYRGLKYSVNNLRQPRMSILQSKQLTLKKLPLNCNKKTLLLDLDETLIRNTNGFDQYEHQTLVFADKQQVKLFFNIRPHCMSFLREMSKIFEVMIFTASTEVYAQAIINYIDPKRKYISNVLSRTNCLETKNGFFIKDLRILKDRDLKNIVLVDNLVHSFGFQIANGIPILEWFGDKTDNELQYLKKYLTQLQYSEDVREFNSKHLRLLELAAMTSSQLEKL